MSSSHMSKQNLIIIPHTGDQKINEITTCRSKKKITNINIFFESVNICCSLVIKYRSFHINRNETFTQKVEIVMIGFVETF